MKKILLLFVVFTCKAQDTLVFKKPDLFKRNYIELGYGKPQGELSNKYDNAINIGYWVRNKINTNQFVDIGLELNFLHSADSIHYKFKNENVYLKSNNVGLHLGVRYSKIVYFSEQKKDFYLESNSGIGWSILFYKIPQELSKEVYDFNPNINTIHLSQTIKLNYKSMGIYFQYKFTPNNLFNSKIDNNFGNSSINIGLVKGFNF